MQEEKEQYEKLIDNVGDRLTGESLNVVIPALTTLLGNAAVMSKVDYLQFITFVMESITEIYNRHGGDSFEVNVHEAESHKLH